MTLTAKNFKFDLFTFDPEWSERSMIGLLDGVKNPLDFKEVLKQNANKISLTTYHTTTCVYWSASEVANILGYPSRLISNRIKDAGLEDGLHFCHYLSISNDITSPHLARTLRKDQLMLNERGLMRLLMYSDKPIAKTFKTWIRLVTEKLGKLAVTEENNQLDRTTPMENEEEIFNNILKQKIREEFQGELPEKYWNLIEGVENPTDDREILMKLALDVGIPVIMNTFEKNGRKNYNLGILWNEMPKLVGVAGTAKQIQDIAHNWFSKNEWVEKDNLIEKSRWSTSVNSTEVILRLPEGYKGRILSNSKFVKLEGIIDLIPILKSNKYNINILSQWLKTLTLVSREYPRLAYETHMRVQQIKQTHQQQLLIKEKEEAETMTRQLQDADAERLRKQHEESEKLRIATEQAQMYARQQAQLYTPLKVKADCFYLVSTPRLANWGVFKLGITENWENRKHQYFTHNQEIQLYHKLNIKNVKFLEEYIGKNLKACGLAYTKHEDGFKDYVVKNSEWFCLSSVEKAKDLMEFMNSSNDKLHEKIKDIRKYIHDKLLSDVGLEPDVVVPEPILQPIKQRVVTKFIEEELKDKDSITYDKLSEFRDAIKTFIRIFKKDKEYSDLPVDAKKLFEDDERIIIEINKKGKTEEIKIKRLPL